VKQVICQKYGEPEVLTVKEYQNREINDNELMIKMYASTISQVDSAFRSGKPFLSRLFTGLIKPKYVPGDIIAGQIIAIGKTVTRFKVGDNVYGHTGITFGAQSESLIIDENEAVVLKPEDMTYEEAAAVAYSAMTALPFILDEVDIDQNSKVLINGASGAIGSFAIQLAKHLGAHVTAVCGESNIALVKSIGADDVINYYKEDFTKNLKSYDVIFDAVGKSNYKLAKASLKMGGTYLTTVPNLNTMIASVTTKNSSRHGKFLATGLRKVDKKIVDLDKLSVLYNENVLKPVIDRSFILEDIRAAHTYVDRGHNKGNVILRMNTASK
jgi:NADPH:quinone reductase-like Zn-dependent oxidoreductase